MIDLRTVFVETFDAFDINLELFALSKLDFPIFWLSSYTNLGFSDSY